MTEEILAHHGVPGMKWGKRKASGFGNNPTVSKALLLGSYGKREAYTDPKALKTRVRAGRLRTAAVLAAVGSQAAGHALAKKDPLGSVMIQGLLSGVAGGLQISATVNGAVGARQEQNARRGK